MSRYTMYYKSKQKSYRDLAIWWKKRSETVLLSEIELLGMSKFFKAIAIRFGLVREFREIGVIQGEGDNRMFYYKVESSHWPVELEFKSRIKLTEGQCFRIKNHNGNKPYPTRFKVRSISDTPTYTGTIVEIFDIDEDVESF